ncbi:FkbM family methyltransferase [Erythromicrobium ramosum]|uniref:FkbM family methyltransferase n=1 Tax=Erythrobacter ramosus TaxID=35811 RepID=A0A6I4UR05_9SPHN|nr:FkbM family methyltransferase [Erythrobacter ramosus]MBB3777210.1 FkbM family methyltransferase [Erythrobacter ramosus]MXP39957.1 FkbM family methyltransferase [Erythrobacter ramosus]
MTLPAEEKSVLEHELGLIFFDDCYGLRDLPKNLKTVVDVGANVGLFSLVARHHFPHAKVFAYEPNPLISSYLRSNLSALDIEIHQEAVGARQGAIKLNLGENSLHSTVTEDPTGEIPMVDFDTVVDRAGGVIDLLKLDCEGGEWDILESSASIGKVNNLAMEFHLWARPERTLEDMTDLIKQRGFKIERIERKNLQDFGLIIATRHEKA